MTDKTNFKLPPLDKMTGHQRTLRKIIVDFRNEFIGEFINMTYDYEESTCEQYWPKEQRTKKYVCDLLYNRVMNCKEKYLRSSVSCVMVETKHVHFLGEQFVRALIEDRVEYSYKHGEWDEFENNYNGLDSVDTAIEQLKSNKYYHFKDANRERWFEIKEVKSKTVKMLELSNNKMHNYKLEGDVLKEMLEDKTATCTNEYK